jgi:hypothetical protein
MGLGKTIEMIAYLILMLELNFAIREVANDQSVKRFDRHLPEGSEDTKCPSDKFSFLCPCLSASLASKFKIRSGPALILTPKGVLNSFLGMWKEFVPETSTKFSLILKVVHGNNHLTDDEWDLLKGEFSPHDKVPSDKEGKRIIYADLCKSTLMPDQDRLVILTITHTYVKWFASKQCCLALQLPFHYFYSRDMLRQIWVPEIAWGHILIDEAHQEKGMSTIPIQLVHTHKEAMRWIYSGTLLMGNLEKDLGNYLSGLYIPQWENDNVLKWGISTNFKKLSTWYNQAIKGTITIADQTGLINNTKTLFPRIMICRTENTYWGKQPLLPIPGKLEIHTVETEPPSLDIYSKVKQLVAQVIQERREALQRESGIQVIKQSWAQFITLAVRIRVCATYPPIVNLINSGKVDCTATQLEKCGWYKELESSPYWSHIDRIIQYSPKIQQLLDLLNGGMFQKNDAGAIIEKFVVYSEVPCSVFIFYLVSSILISSIQSIILYQDTPH